MNERRVQDFLYAKYGEERIRTVVVQGGRMSLKIVGLREKREATSGRDDGPAAEVGGMTARAAR